MSRKKFAAPSMNPDRVREIQERRRSSAAGPINSGKTTRRASKSRAIKESRFDV